MQNILLIHCRRRAKLSPHAVKKNTGIAPRRYSEIEKAGALIEWEEAISLGRLFNVEPTHVYQYSLQLEMLRTTKELLVYHKQKLHDKTTHPGLRQTSNRQLQTPNSSFQTSNSFL